MSKFRYKETEIKINITYWEALNDFDELGLDILSMVSDQNAIVQILADDRTMIKVWWYYVKDIEPEFDTAIKQLTPGDMQQFKEAFWDAVVNFSPVPVRETLREMWRLVKEELKHPERRLKNLLSDSQEEQE